MPVLFVIKVISRKSVSCSLHIFTRPRLQIVFKVAGKDVAICKNKLSFTVHSVIFEETSVCSFVGFEHTITISFPVLKASLVAFSLRSLNDSLPIVLPIFELPQILNSRSKLKSSATLLHVIDKWPLIHISVHVGVLTEPLLLILNELTLISIAVFIFDCSFAMEISISKVSLI